MIKLRLENGEEIPHLIHSPKNSKKIKYAPLSCGYSFYTLESSDPSELDKFRGKRVKFYIKSYTYVPGAFYQRPEMVWCFEGEFEKEKVETIKKED